MCAEGDDPGGTGPPGGIHFFREHHRLACQRCLLHLNQPGHDEEATGSFIGFHTLVH